MQDELSVLQALARPLPDPQVISSSDAPSHRSKRKAQQARHAINRIGRLYAIRLHAKERIKESIRQKQRANRTTRKVKMPPPPLLQKKTRVLKAQLRRAYHETQVELARLNSQIQPLSAEQHAQAVADLTAKRRSKSDVREAPQF